MKIYISCDMEGVAGVCSWEQVRQSSSPGDYPMVRRWMTQEVAAAIAGAREHGEVEILVNDSHGHMHNLLLDELPDDIRVISGNRKPFSMVEGIDASFDGAFFIGYHGAIGDQNAVLCHTYTPSVMHNVYLNGIRCSEATLNAALLGYFGVPLLCISGDRTTVEGVQRDMPWVQGAILKDSIGNFAANSLTPAAGQRLIRAVASSATASIADGDAKGKGGKANIFRLDPPVKLEIETAQVEQADLIELMPGFERLEARRVRFVHDDYPTIFRAFVAAFRLGAAA